MCIVGNNQVFFFFSYFCFSSFLESSPHSGIESVMDKLGGETNRKEANGPAVNVQPKKSRRRHLLHNVFDILAIAISREDGRSAGV